MNSWIVSNLWLIPAVPLVASFFILILANSRRRTAAALATLGQIAALALSITGFLPTLQTPGFRAVHNFTWFTFGDQALRLGWVLDPLAAAMMIMITLVGLCIFVFSVGYMAGDKNLTRFFAYLSFFSGAMLGVVIANSLLLLFFSWELVGLASYLLIGFWIDRPSAAAAAKKAFITTRIGDLGFFLGTLWLFHNSGTLLFYDQGRGCLEEAGLLAIGGSATFIALLIFCGAVGKSGQFPLHAWLPDAMEGPTPVSALIHAATMVAAGVYLTARSFIFLVPLAPGVQPPFTAILVIAGIGGFTAIFAATMAVVNNDIKRVLAFSTISQLAYMFLGLGAGAYLMATEAVNGEPVNSAGYSAALYHLFNHAFFKALLFLSAGSVIHAVHTNDMREMGGLSKSMPITSRVMLFGSLALAGIIPFSGLFSKGAILSVTFDAVADHPGLSLLYLLGLSTAFLTAFYAFRLWFMTFHGEYRGHDHPHESPRVMTTPLLILAGFTLISGLLAYPMQGFGNLVFFGRPEAGFPLVGIPPVHYLLEALSLGVAGLGIWLAWSIYETKRIPAERFTRAPGGAFIHRMLTKRYWIDDAYDAFGRTVVYGIARGLDWFDRTAIDGIVNAVGRGGMRVAVEGGLFDRRVIDGAVNALSLETVRTSWRLRQRQTGQVQNYAWVVVVGIVAVVVLLFGFGFLQPFLEAR